MDNRADRIKSLLHAALDLPLEHRLSFLQGACGADTPLCDEVVSLLAAADSAAAHEFLVFPNVCEADNRIDSRVGPFRITRFLGQGGMGAVFEAEREEYRQTVAVKLLRPDLVSEEIRQRFLNEQTLLVRLNHPGIVPVHHIGVHEGEPFYAMRLIPGTSLQQQIDPLFQQPSPETARMHALLRRLISVCDTMSYAHDQGILHRDLKPSNIMIGEYGETLVVDWGLAKELARADADDVSKMPSLVGTPTYMSPEQMRGEDTVGVRSDVYSLGATLHTLLTGKPPRSNADLNKPWIARPLSAICRKAIASDPQARYASCRELARDLEAYLAGEAVSACPDRVVDRFTRWTRKRPGQFAALASALLVGLLATLIGIVWVTALNNDLREANERETKEREKATEQARIAEARRMVTKALVSEWYDTIAQDHEMQKTPGTERLRRKLLDRAQKFYENASAETPDSAEAMDEVATANLDLATIDRRLNPGLDVLLPMKRALVYRRRAVALDPTNDSYRLRLATSLMNLGIIHSEMASPKEASAAYRESATILEELLPRTNLENVQAALANTLGNHGSMLLDTAPKEAHKLLIRSRDAYRELLAGTPESTFYADSLSPVLNNIALSARYSGDLAAAKAGFADLIRDREARLAKLPGNLELTSNLANAINNYAGTLREHHLPVEAKKQLLRVVELMETPTLKHPLPNYVHILTNAYVDLAYWEFQQGELKHAMEWIGKGLPMRRKLAAEVKTMPILSIRFARALWVKSLIELRLVLPKESLATVSEAITRLEQLHAANKGEEETKMLLIQCYRTRALAYQKLGQLSEALADLNQGSKVAKKAIRDVYPVTYCLIRASQPEHLREALIDAQTNLPAPTEIEELTETLALLGALYEGAQREKKSSESEKGAIRKQLLDQATVLVRTALSKRESILPYLAARLEAEPLTNALCQEAAFKAVLAHGSK